MSKKRMMLKKPIFFLIPLVILILSECSTKSIQDLHEEAYSKMASRTVDKMFPKIGPKLAKKYGLSYVGNGAEMSDGPVKKLCLDYEIRHKLDTAEARRILFNIGTDFLSAINNDKQLYQFLIDKPATFKNLGIRIFIFDSRKNEVFDTDIGLAEIFEGNFIYITNSSVFPHTCLKEYEETYDEAKAILDKEDSANIQAAEGEKKNDA